MSDRRCLFVFLGECFRVGGQFSRDRGCDESYEMQKIASESHLNFMRHVSGLGVTTRSLVVTYDTKFDEDVRTWYGEGRVHIIHGAAVGYHGLYRVACDIILQSNETYEFVQFIRIDLVLKRMMYELFDPKKFGVKIVYSSPVWIDHCRTQGNCIRVADMIMYVPKELFDRVLFENCDFLSHEGAYVCYLKSVPYGFMLSTLHDSDSQKDWNPLYFIANRNRERTWASKGLYYIMKNDVITEYGEECQDPEICRVISEYEYEQASHQ